MGQQAHWMLTIRDESKPSFTVMLASGEKVVIGRSRSCEIVLSDPAVSRKHCFFGVDEDGVLKLVDLGAQHPTSLNGALIKAGCAFPVQDGFEVRLGRGSVIKVECLSGNLSGKVGHAGSLDDDDLETHTAVLEQPVSAEAEDVNPADDPLKDGEPGGSGNKETSPAAGGVLHSDVLQPASSKGDEERTADNDTLEEQSQSSAPRNSSDLQAETSLVNVKEFTRQPRPERPNSPKAGGGSPPPEDAPSSADDGRKADADEATRLNPVNASKPLDSKKVNKSAPPADVHQNHTQVLGQTLQGKLTQLKESKPDPVSNRPRPEANDPGGGNGDAEVVTSLSGGDGLDETNCIDPTQLQKNRTGMTPKGGNNRSAPERSARNGDNAGNPVPSDAGAQDETSYVDPAELRKLMTGKAQKGSKSGSVSRGPSMNGDAAGNTAPSDGGADDETNYVDPAELKRLMKGKVGSPRNKDGKKGPAPKKPSPSNDEGNSTLPDGDANDETNFIDPAELQKLMKGKAGLFGKKSKKKRAASRQPSRNGDAAGNTAPSGGDSQDETNFIDPAELQKLMKGKTKSPRSNRGRSR